MRRSLVIIVPADMTEADLIACLASPRKFMARTGGEINCLRYEPARLLDVYAGCVTNGAERWRVQSFAAPDPATVTGE